MSMASPGSITIKFVLDLVEIPEGMLFLCDDALYKLGSLHASYTSLCFSNKLPPDCFTKPVFDKMTWYF